MGRRRLSTVTGYSRENLKVKKLSFCSGCNAPTILLICKGTLTYRKRGAVQTPTMVQPPDNLPMRGWIVIPPPTP